MKFVRAIKNFFTRGKYKMTVSKLIKITDHPKIAVSATEYDRINKNLKYYNGAFDDVKYLNSAGETKTRPLNHLPLGRTAAKKLASLVFNEKAEIKVSGPANEFIKETLSEDRFNKNFERYLESALALGGMAMRPYVDGNKIRVAFIQAPVFYSLQSNTQDISSAVIANKTIRTEKDKVIYYTLLEFHEWVNSEDYVITNELYRSEASSEVGHRVPLSEVYDDLKEEIKGHGLSRPLFTYLKTPGMNNKDINSPLGLSIFDNALTTMDFINTTYDEFMWEVKMGQRRVAVSEGLTYMRVTQEDGDVLFKPRFDADHNVFIQLGANDLESVAITDLTTPIRSDDYIKAINEGLSLFEMQIGVSPGMFTFDGKSMKTATEVVSENSDTYQMRNSIVTLVEQSIKELVISICELAKASDLYSGDIPEMEKISVNLDDGVFTDRDKELDYYTKALASGLISKSHAIQKVFKVDEKEAARMLSEINKDILDDANNERSHQDIDTYGE